MPELPEVENVVRGLQAGILGSRIVNVRCHFKTTVGGDADCFEAALRYKTIERITRHGKYIFLRLIGGDQTDGTVSGRGLDRRCCSVELAVHLRMTGQLLLVERGSEADKHTHLEIFFEGGDSKIVYRDVRKFGRLLLLEGGIEEFLEEKKLGEDALKITEAGLFQALSRTKRNIKATLLDQRTIAGMGNIYTDEVLFREGISPLRGASTLSPKEIASLLATIRKVLRAAIAGRGTTISDYLSVLGRSGSYQHELLVYNREGLPCSRCGTPVSKSKVAGRGTYFCPNCQS